MTDVSGVATTGGSLAGKRAIITGSSRGLGRAYAKAMAEEGAAVVVNGTTADLVESAVGEIRAAGGDAVGVVASVASFDDAERVVSTCVESFGGVDIVVNNAGIVRERMMFNMSEEEFRTSLDVDCFGTFAVSRFAVRDMRARGWGRIVNVGDISAQSGLLGGTAVAAAKGAIHGMTYTWAAELARWGITANCILPLAYSRLHDALFRKAIELAEQREKPEIPTFEELRARTARPEEITALLLYLVGEESHWLTGHVLTMHKDQVALWSHAARKVSLRADEQLTLEVLREQMHPTFGAHVEPVGTGEPWEL